MSISKPLIVLGVLLIALGVLVPVIQRYPWLYSWFGNLPGDIRYEGKGSFIYAPIVSMLILSAVVSAIGYVVQRWFR